MISDIDFRKIHSCSKSEGKIVGISVDKLGVTRCGYCNEVVDYTSHLKACMKKWNENNIS